MTTERCRNRLLIVTGIRALEMPRTQASPLLNIPNPQRVDLNQSRAWGVVSQFLPVKHVALRVEQLQLFQSLCWGWGCAMRTLFFRLSKSSQCPVSQSISGFSRTNIIDLSQKKDATSVYSSQPLPPWVFQFVSGGVFVFLFPMRCLHHAIASDL